jgi:hypothetical protein
MIDKRKTKTKQMNMKDLNKSKENILERLKWSTYSSS